MAGPAAGDLRLGITFFGGADLYASQGSVPKPSIIPACLAAEVGRGGHDAAPPPLTWAAEDFDRLRDLALGGQFESPCQFLQAGLDGMGGFGKQPVSGLRDGLEMKRGQDFHGRTGEGTEFRVIRAGHPYARNRKLPEAGRVDLLMPQRPSFEGIGDFVSPGFSDPGRMGLAGTGKDGLGIPVVQDAFPGGREAMAAPPGIVGEPFDASGCMGQAVMG